MTSALRTPLGANILARVLAPACSGWDATAEHIARATRNANGLGPADKENTGLGARGRRRSQPINFGACPPSASSSHSRSLLVLATPSRQGRKAFGTPGTTANRSQAMVLGATPARRVKGKDVAYDLDVRLVSVCNRP